MNEGAYQSLSKILITMKLDARKLEKLEIQLAKSRTARIFNPGHLANKVTPKNHANQMEKFEQATTKKAECSLIHNRIKCTNIKINHLQTDLETIFSRCYMNYL